MRESVRVGTRGSRLARIQTDLVLTRLRRTSRRVEFRAVPIETSGDRDRAPGGSPDFTDAIDRALVHGAIDLAVHSAKDLPTGLDPRLELLASPPRASPRDCLVTSSTLPGPTLPRGARVGSSSPRRRAQLLRWRPDLSVVEVRGNVETRLDLVRQGRVDTVMLAVAGLARLGLRNRVRWPLPFERFLPSPGQGALAIVGRRDSPELARIARRVNHAPTLRRLAAERAVAAALGADCRTPFGALATVRGRSLHLDAEVLTDDGRRTLRLSRGSTSAGPEKLGRDLGRAMLDHGGGSLTPTPPR